MIEARVLLMSVVGQNLSRTPAPNPKLQQPAMRDLLQAMLIKRPRTLKKGESDRQKHIAMQMKTEKWAEA